MSFIFPFNPTRQSAHRNPKYPSQRTSGFRKPSSTRPHMTQPPNHPNHVSTPEQAGPITTRDCVSCRIRICSTTPISTSRIRPQDSFRFSLTRDQDRGRETLRPLKRYVFSMCIGISMGEVFSQAKLSRGPKPGKAGNRGRGKIVPWREAKALS